MPRLTDLGHALRLTRACFTLAREGALIGIDPTTLPPLARLPLALANILAKRGARGLDGLAAAFGRLRVRVLCRARSVSRHARLDIVGFRVAGELEKLQDRVTPTERAAAVAAIEAAFGAPIATLYVEFGEPVAAASVAQVHRARVRDADGERDVAVKLLRPGESSGDSRAISPTCSTPRAAPRVSSRGSDACGSSRWSKRWRAACASKWTCG